MKPTLIFIICLLFLNESTLAQSCNKEVSKLRRKQIQQADLRLPILNVVQLYTYRRRFLWQATFNSTASFIHPRVLITAGHNLANKDTEVKKITIKIGCTDKDSFLLKQSFATKMNSNIYVVPSYNQRPSFEEDFGIIILPDSTLYNRVKGNFKLTNFSKRQKKGDIIMTGYPEPNTGIKLWTDKTSNFSLINNLLKYDFYAEKGASGSPIYNSANQLIAIHTGGTDEPKQCNIATPINDKIIYFIKRWCTENNISIDSR